MLTALAPYVLIISVTALAAVFALAVDRADKQHRRRRSTLDWPRPMNDPETSESNLARVIAAARALNPGAAEGELVDLARNRPIASLGNLTALELIEAGRTDDVVAYLNSLQAGWVG